MKKTVLSYIFDGVTVAITSFILSYAVSAFYLTRGAPPVIIGVSVAVAVTAFYILVSKSKRTKFAVKKSEEKEFSNFISALRFLPKEKVRPLIEKTIIAENDYLFCDFKFSPVSADDVLSAFKQTPENKKLVFCAVDFIDETENLLQPLKDRLRLVSGKELFSLFKEKGEVLKADMPNPEKKSQKIKEMLKNTFRKKRAGGLALYGISLIVLSRFVFYPLWYIIIGSAFLIYALAIKFFAAE